MRRPIAFFRQKINLPTATWTDIWQAMHTKAFVVAGAIKADLIQDLRDAVDRAISEGTTLEEFRKAFDDTVARHGWSYKGGRNWRSRLIFETNIRTAYAEGRWQQMTDPELLKVRPYLLYRHGDSRHPRPHHLAWDGLVLPSRRSMVAHSLSTQRLGLQVPGVLHLQARIESHGKKRTGYGAR